MNTYFTLKELSSWVANLIKAAEEDSPFLVSWFDGTKDKNIPFSIVGGWSDGFADDFNKVIYISKSCPTDALCIKIVVNDGPYAYVDFDLLTMPTNVHNEVEDTCIALERNDDPTEIARFYLGEWERIMSEHSKEDV